MSVIVANYNYGRFLPDTVESVLKQTYPHFELIICDDGSTDESRTILPELERGEHRIKVLYKENGGQASAWNLAYTHCRGEIICLLDADDRYMPDKLEKIVRQFHAEPQTGLIIHPMIVVDSADRPVQQIPFLTHFERGWIAQRLVDRGGRWRDMPSSALSFRRELAEQVFPIPEAEFRRSADGYVFTLMPLLTKVSAVEKALTLYRVHGANALSSIAVDIPSVCANIESAQSQIAAVNRALAKQTSQERVLQLEVNLTYRQNALLLSLLNGESRLGLLKQYRHLAPILLKDDLYSVKQKGLGLVVYGVAIIVPEFARGWWLSTALGYSSLKYRIQRVLQSFRRRASRAEKVSET